MVKQSRIDAFVILFIFLITMFISVIGGILLFLLYVLLNSKFSSASFFYVIFIFALIAFTQYSSIKEGDYDMVKYYSHYTLIALMDLNGLKLLVFEKGDVFFYTLMFFLTRFFPNDPRVMAFFFLFATSICNYFAWKYLFTDSNKKLNHNISSYNKTYIILWILSFFLILNFPNLSNAYRQYFALSLFFLALSRKSIGKNYIIFILLSIMTHWSMIIYLSAFLFVKFSKNNYKIVFIGSLIVALLINFILPIIPFLGDKIAAYIHGEEILGVDKTAIAINIIVQIGLLVYLLNLKKISETYVTLLLSLISYTIIFIFNSTIITRHFFFVSNFILVVILLNNFMNSKYNSKNLLKNNLSYAIVLSLTMFLNLKQMYLGNFEYWFFSKQWYLMSGYSILTTPFPYEIIR